MRRDEPDALPRCHVHYAADRVNELIGAMGMFVYFKPARILICKR
jgi:hypothetical protein